MGTIAEKLEYLNTTKTQLREAINNKGGSLTTSSPFRDYVDAVSAIQMAEQHTDYTGSYTVTENGTLQTAGKAMAENIVVNVPARGALEAAWDAYKNSHTLDWSNAFQSPAATTTIYSTMTDLSSLDFSVSKNKKPMKTRNMFSNCASLITVPLFDTSNVSDMMSMFSNCTSLTTVPAFNTSKVTIMSSMFSWCTSLTTVPAFNTSKVETMRSMFSNCTSLTTVPLFDTSSVTDMAEMFTGCSNLVSVPAFDASNETWSMSNTFYQCSNLETIHMFGMKVNLDISFSTKYTREALVEIINNCADLTGGKAKTLTMGPTNLAKLTDEDKAIATNKNWTLA